MIEHPVGLGGVRLDQRTSIGAFTYFNYGCEVSFAKIGRYCSIGQNVLIGPGRHYPEFVTTHPLGTDPSGISSGMAKEPMFHAAKFTSMSHLPLRRARETIIGNDVWIGARAIIMDGVSIGDGAIIGAAAIVTKDVEPYAIVGGNPARLIRFRFEEAICHRLRSLAWWDYDLSQLPERDFSNPELFIKVMEEAIASNLPKFIPREAS